MSRAGQPGILPAFLLAAFVLAGPGISSARADDGFTISGEVDGLYPGVRATLEARVTNPHPFSIVVTSVTAVAADARASCPASMLEIEGTAEPVEVPARETAVVLLAVRMDRDAPDACQGATWPLTFRGQAFGDDGSGLPNTMVRPSGVLIGLVAIGTGLIGLGILLVRRRGISRRTM